jgi:hypothetical protein
MRNRGKPVAGAARVKKKMVNASELARMGACERLVLFEARHGSRKSPCQQEATERGTTEHGKFFREGVRSRPELQTSLSKPWCFCASLAWGPEANETELLRRFRDQILRRASAGRWMISMYYRTAPGLCRRLEGRKRLVSALRLGLKPALWIAGAALALLDEERTR